MAAVEPKLDGLFPPKARSGMLRNARFSTLQHCIQRIYERQHLSHREAVGDAICMFKYFLINILSWLRRVPDRIAAKYILTPYMYTHFI